MRLSSAQRLTAALLAVLCALLSVAALLRGKGLERPALTGPGAGMPAGLREVNYYPAANSWYRMWTHWDAGVVDRDFARAASLGANAVRLIVFPQYFGFPQPTSTMTGRLHDAIGLAARHGLRVQLCLFDHFTDYAATAASAEWTRALLARYRDDERVPVIEVQNEVDPTSRAVLRWLRAEIRTIHGVLPGTAVTVSTDSASGVHGPQLLKAALSGAEPDFFDYHYYGAAQNALDMFQAVRALVAPSPVFVGETGRSSAARDAADATDGDYEAAVYLATVANAATLADLPPPAPWTLNDYTRAGQPYRDPHEAEYHYGLFTTSGRPKPAALAVATAFGAAGPFARRYGLPAPPPGRDTNDPGFAGVVAAEHRPAAWTHGANAHYEVAAGQAPGGGNRAVISASHGTASFSTVPSQVVYGGQHWSVSAQVRGRATTGTTRVSVVWTDAAGTRLGSAHSAALPAGRGTWTTLVATGTAPATAQRAVVSLESDDDSGVAEFADVSWSVDGRGNPQRV